ncbi:MAG TPA: aldo/keto reductase [Opitutaceae bacterium]
MHPLSSRANAGIHRRDFLKTVTLAFASPALMPRALRAVDGVPSASNVITKKLPRTGEAIPAIGLGTFLTFDILPGRPREHLGEVLRRYWEGGARVIDTSPLYGTAELSVGDFAASLGITDQMFTSNKIWSTGEFLADESHARRSLEQSLQRLWRGQIDLMHCHSLVNVDMIVPYLQAWKKEGLIRYVGVSHHENAYMDALASWVRRGAVDIVQVNYSIFNRAAEERVLPAASAQGVGVLVNMPLEKARLHKVVEGHPLPDFAREIGIENWSQYFLKWAISHPAVTCALPSTANPAHASENIGALQGALPDENMRARMVRHMESIPGFRRIGEMPWYPDKNYDGIIGRARAALNART